MASINLTKLKPGKTYVAKVRAVDEEGNYSQYSFGYSFTVPATNVDGTQLTATNNSVVTALAPNSSSATGGALIAGGLNANGAANAGALNLGNVWNGTASSIAKLTGTANTGAVVINSTGILGYQLSTASSGQANFFLDTASGNAYFRGTVYANSGQIGGFLINNSSLSASTLFNKLTSFDPSFEDQWEDYWTASANYFGRTDKGLELVNDETLNPIQAGLRYARFSVFGVGNSSNISASSMEMTMFKTASSKIAFSQSDLGISSGSNYTLSVYVQDLKSEIIEGSTITLLPALIYLKINKYNGPGTSSATLISSQVSSIFTTNTTTWTRASGSFTTASGEYYTFSIINAQGYTPGGSGYKLASSDIAVDAIQLEPGNTANSFGFDNYFAVNPADSTKPINLSSISNTGSTSNIFSVYTDGGTYANYFFSNKQSKIGNVYFGGTGLTNISIGDYYATHNMPDGNNVNVGIWSLGLLTSGSNNIALGYYAGTQLQYGSNNVFIGSYNLSSELSGSAGGLTPVNNSIFISDGAGNLRIKSDSSGLVTITGSASVTGTITAASFIGNGAGLTGITASTTGSITIGSTVIGLGETTASLSGLTSLAISANSTSTILDAYNTVTNNIGGGISLSTNATAQSGTNTATGGAISITTNGSNSGANTSATSGSINISTSVTGAGAVGSTGGNISIRTTGGGVSSPGSITLSSGNGFTISSTNVGTINNFNIGGITPGSGSFTAINITSGSLNSSSTAVTIFATPSSVNIGSANTSKFTNISPGDFSGVNTVNIAAGYVTNGTGIVNIATGFVSTASNIVNILTGTLSTGAQSINIGTGSGTSSKNFVFGNSASNSSASFNANVFVSGNIDIGANTIIAASFTGTVASATNSSSAGYSSSAGTSASLGGIVSSSYALQSYANSASLNAYNLAIANSFSASNTTTNSTGTAVTLYTLGLNTSGTSSALGGAINITTQATNVGSSVSASSGAINITTTAGTGSAYSTVGGNINIKTLSATGSVNTAGNIIITSSGGFTILSSSVGTIDNFNIGATTAGTGNFTSLAISGASVATQSYVSSSAYNNTSASVGYAASVGSVIVGGILNSSSTNFNLLSTPNTITAFSAASSLTIGFQNNGTSIMNIGNQGNTGTRTLNLFTTLGGSGGQNTINIGASGATLSSTPQVINIGNATGTYNTITIGGSTDTALTLNATASVTGKITAASFVGNGAGLTNIPTSALSASTITIGSTSTALGGTSTSLSGLNSISASTISLSSSITATSASVSGTVTAASFVGSGAGLTGLMGALVYSASFASASAISFNNVFSASYTNYKIVITFSSITSTSFSPIKFAFRAAGSDFLGASTYSNLYQGYSSFTSGYTASSFFSNSFVYGPTAANLATGQNLVLEAYGPATTTSRKEVVSQSYLIGNPGGTYTLSHTGYNTSASAFDGFSLLASSSSINYTGTIKIYGYSN
jgi:hypothetical protein